MADISIAAQQGAGIPPSLEPSFTGSLTTTDTYVVPNDGRTKLYFKKGAGTDSVVTFETPVTFKGLAVADPTVTVPANEERDVGPFPPSLYGSTIRFTVTEVANLTVAALRT